MGHRNFGELLNHQWYLKNFVCVGLDSDFARIPESAQWSNSHSKENIPKSIRKFNRAIVEATCDLVGFYKPNSAFYEKYGTVGFEALRSSIRDIHDIAPDVPVVLDAKRGDIGNTNDGYVDAAFSFFEADAITVHPYLGSEALRPFLDQEDKGIIVLCRTSNPGAGEFQDLLIDGKPLYQHVAHRVSETWNKNGNCALVVGATYPDELREVRRIVGDMPILIPGIGAQGGDVEKTVTAGKDSRGRGMIINSSRGIIFASKEKDFAQVAREETQKLREMINRYR